MTIQLAKFYGKAALVSSPTPALDTEVLLQYITGFDKTHLLSNRDTELSAEQESRFRDAIGRRKTGFPVAYITGHKEFFGYDFCVTPDVLIPKPDTELLVELALAALEDKFRANPNAIPTVCDMCAGSGCVGISIAKTLSDKMKTAPKSKFSTFNFQFSISLVDISEKALDVARKNAMRLLSESKDERSDAHSQKERESQSHESNYELCTVNCAFIQSNLFENIPQSFDVIVTNPPYVPHSESLELLKDGRSEPLLALDGDVTENGEPSGTNDGLALIRRLVPQCHEHLNPNGVLIMETGEYNAEETAELFRRAGFRAVRIERDLNEQLRDVCGVK